MQDNQDKETSTDEVQAEYRRIQKKIPVELTFSAPVQTDPGANPAYTVDTGSLCQGKVARAWR